MRILHYFLGFPPYRTGGLTKFALDLMSSQATEQHIVMALWPGQIKHLSKSPIIKKRKNKGNIQNYELINPLPIPLDEGITAFEQYMKPSNITIYESLFRELSPDVIHIHTLMGLHQEFIQAAKAMHIKTIFTTHDYFGICPMVTLYSNGASCENDHDCHDCIHCNRTALSLHKIMLMQSPLYRVLKDTGAMKLARKYHRNQFYNQQNIPLTDLTDSDFDNTAKKYKELRGYYLKMLQDIDLIHFNSTLTESIYRKYITPNDSTVITITHTNISDNRKSIHWQYSGKLKIAYLASIKPYKGFQILKQALDELWNEGKHDFILKMYNAPSEYSPYIIPFDKEFQYSRLDSVFEDIDVLVAPSIWYETFGFTVLEAISYGVPVIISDHVGAKDLVQNTGIIVKAGSTESLKNAISSFTPETIRKLRENILIHSNIKTWGQFINEIYKIYGDKQEVQKCVSFLSC